MFFHSCSYKNSCFSEFVYNSRLQCNCANDLQLQGCSQRCYFRFCGFAFEDLLLVYIAIAYPLICATKEKYKFNSRITVTCMLMHRFSPDLIMLAKLGIHPNVTQKMKTNYDKLRQSFIKNILVKSFMSCFFFSMEQKPRGNNPIRYRVFCFGA